MYNSRYSWNVVNFFAGQWVILLLTRIAYD